MPRKFSGAKRLVVVSLVGAVAAVASGCTGATNADRYESSAGWSLRVPAGWHLLHFRDSTDGITSVGVQLSNARLPAPSIDPGYPVQVNGEVLPARDVAIVIATDDDPRLAHGRVSLPPLAPGNWSVGSAPGGAPWMETMWFRAGGQLLLADAKIGANAPTGEQKAVDQVIRSLKT